MFEYLMLGDVHARKYSKTSARTCSILEKFEFDTTLLTGTPAGVGPVKDGDVLEGELLVKEKSLVHFKFPVIQRK